MYAKEQQQTGVSLPTTAPSLRTLTVTRDAAYKFRARGVKNGCD